MKMIGRTYTGLSEMWFTMKEILGFCVSVVEAVILDSWIFTMPTG